MVMERNILRTWGGGRGDRRPFSARMSSGSHYFAIAFNAHTLTCLRRSHIWRSWIKSVWGNEYHVVFWDCEEHYYFVTVTHQKQGVAAKWWPVDRSEVALTPYGVAQHAIRHQWPRRTGTRVSFKGAFMRKIALLAFDKEAVVLERQKAFQASWTRSPKLWNERRRSCWSSSFPTLST